MMNGGSMMWENGMWFGPLMMIIVLGLIVAAVVIIVKMFSGGSKARDNSLAILKERFASGDINEEEYEMKRKVLRG